MKNLLLLLPAVLLLSPASRADASEQASPATEDEAVRAVNLLAPELYREFAASGGVDKNICFSPFSISSAFAMVYAGASGSTADEMKKFLHYDGEGIHDAYSALIKGLTSAPEGSGNLLIANSIWPQRGYRLLSSFTDLLKKAYDTEVRLVDYKGNAEQSRLEINEWVAGRTMGKIKDILPANSVNRESKLVLVNALYFKAPWLEEFSSAATSDADFFAAAGRRTVRMMRSVRYAPYFETEDLQVVKLPYARGLFSMLIILPRDRDGLPALEGKIDAEMLNLVSSRPERKRVDLNLPKFKIESSFDVADAVKKLGVKSAFDKDLADFSSMNGKRDLVIDAASHKVFVETDEKGTEAAAATAIAVARTTSIIRKDEPVVFRADHPFIFLILDEASGAILFLGRMAAP
jgi:serpin B